VISAIKEQNLQAPAGKIGGAPSPKDQEFTYTVSAPGRLISATEFENIILRESETGAQIRIKDVGRAELGAQNYDSYGRLNGQPSGAMAVYLLPGANQLKASEAIYETMAKAKELFPSDMDYKIVYDTTPASRRRSSRSSTRHRGDHPRHAGRLRLPAELPRDADPAPDRAGLAARDLHLLPDPGFSVNTLSMFGLVLAIASWSTTRSWWSRP